MLKPEQQNRIIGAYLAELIDRRYPSRRAFCKAYLRCAGEEPAGDALTNMSNRLSQIIKGLKSIQTYDLLHFSQLLGVSCEQILSGGAYAVPVANRITNYAIAHSSDPAEWKAYIQREDKLILNCDEYCKNVIDYALEFGNYAFLKYLMDHDYIWFVSEDSNACDLSFRAGTSIRRRDIGHTDTAMLWDFSRERELRVQMIALAAAHNDLKMLKDLRAREHPELYAIPHFMRIPDPEWTGPFKGCFRDHVLRQLAAAGEEVLDYFTDPIVIPDRRESPDGQERSHTFLFPDISRLLDLLITTGSPLAETALKKALKHNKSVYKKLCDLAAMIKADEYCVNSCDPELWLKICREDMEFHEEVDVALFKAYLSIYHTRKYQERIAANIAHVTKRSPSPILNHLAQELNESYDAIHSWKDHLQEVIK